MFSVFNIQNCLSSSRKQLSSLHFIPVFGRNQYPNIEVQCFYLSSGLENYCFGGLDQMSQKLSLVPLFLCKSITTK